MFPYLLPIYSFFLPLIITSISLPSRLTITVQAEGHPNTQISKTDQFRMTEPLFANG